MFTWYSEGSSAREDQTSQPGGTNARREEDSICPSPPVARCSCVPSSTFRSHPDKERTLQPAVPVWNCASHILGRAAPPPAKSEQNVQPSNITQQPNSPLQSSDGKCRLTRLHLSDGVIARLHIQMSICLTVWYTDRAYTLEAKFTPVVISLTPVAITQRTNLAHSVS